MQHTSLSTTVNADKLKKRKLVASKLHDATSTDIANQIKRLKSNQGIQTVQKQNKPRSSIGRRPASSRKPSQTAHSNTTTSSAMGESEVRDIMNNIFSHSKIIKDFTKKKNIELQDAHQLLISNELFILSLVTMVSNMSGEEASEYIEQKCVNKLERIVAMERQKKLCEGIQNKIGVLLDSRLKILSSLK